VPIVVQTWIQIPRLVTSKIGFQAIKEARDRKAGDAEITQIFGMASPAIGIRKIERWMEIVQKWFAMTIVVSRGKVMKGHRTFENIIAHCKKYLRFFEPFEYHLTQPGPEVVVDLCAREILKPLMSQCRFLAEILDRLDEQLAYLLADCIIPRTPMNALATSLGDKVRLYKKLANHQ
jgi:hypothetical protein